MTSTSTRTRSRFRSRLLVGLSVAASLVFGAGVALAIFPGWTASTHPVVPASFGTPRSFADLSAVVDQPGPVMTETVVSANWAVDRSGLINLESPKAKQAGLKDGDEPISIYFHVIRHPVRGTFLIDTGVERALRDDPSRAAPQGMVVSAMHLEKLTFKTTLGDWLSSHGGRVNGVFFTHLHLDHVMGAPDLPKDTPLFSGPGEVGARARLFFFTQDTEDRALAGLPPIGEWQFHPDPAGRFQGILDVFGDGSFWALSTPGHTSGSTSYLARTPHGPVLYVGDTCITRWGWNEEVEPGTFTDSPEENRKSLHALRQLYREHPGMEVHLGHQNVTGELR